MFKLHPYEDGLAYSPDEAAARGPYTKKTLAKWRWQGTGPQFFKVRGRVYYRGADLNEFLRDGAEAA